MRWTSGVMLRKECSLCLCPSPLPVAGVWSWWRQSQSLRRKPRVGVGRTRGRGSVWVPDTVEMPVSSEPCRKRHLYLVRVSAFGEFLLAEAKHGPVTTAKELPVPFLPGPRMLKRSPHALCTVWKPHWIWSPSSEVPVPCGLQVENLHSQRESGGGLPMVRNQIFYPLTEAP